MRTKTFEEWWQTLTPSEHKVLGKNNAAFVWEEAQKHAIIETHEAEYEKSQRSLLHGNENVQ